MITDSVVQTEIREQLGFLQQDPEFCTQFMQVATAARLPSKYRFMEEGSECSGLALIRRGKVRVYKLGENGREITLYRLGSGESCVLTASCIMSNTRFPALATTESEVDALLIPTSIVHEWVDRHKVWRQFIFDLVSQRLVDVITVIEEVAFKRMDSRLAAYLLDQSRNSDSPLHVTHQTIATELGTAREVISRLLKELELGGAISLARGTISVIDRSMLKVKTGAF